jgi:hypothetical protein
MWEQNRCRKFIVHKPKCTWWVDGSAIKWLGFNGRCKKRVSQIGDESQRIETHGKRSWNRSWKRKLMEIERQTWTTWSKWGISEGRWSVFSLFILAFSDATLTLTSAFNANWLLWIKAIGSEAERCSHYYSPAKTSEKRREICKAPFLMRKGDQQLTYYYYYCYYFIELQMGFYRVAVVLQ